MKADDLPREATPIAGKPRCLRELGSIAIRWDPWMANYFVTDPVTREFESFSDISQAQAYALQLHGDKVRACDPSRYGLGSGQHVLD